MYGSRNKRAGMVERTNQRQRQIVSLASISSITAASRSTIICHHSNSGIVPPLHLMPFSEQLLFRHLKESALKEFVPTTNYESQKPQTRTYMSV
jgi:hypothetical protein